MVPITHMREDFVENSIGKLSYTSLGSGQLSLICFHGYGHTKESMLPISEALPDFTIYSFDLFFHGTSKWQKSTLDLEPHELISLLNLFLEKQAINSFSLLGYSMGARYILAVIPGFASRIEKILLIAPDGFRSRNVFAIATSTFPGRLLFKFMMIRPKPVKVLTTLSTWFGVWQNQARFAMTQLQSKANRRKVYQSWMVVRKLSLPLNQLGKILVNNNIHFMLFTAKYDKVVTADWKQICRILTTIKLYTLPSGHSNLLLETIAFLKANKDTLLDSVKIKNT